MAPVKVKTTGVADTGLLRATKDSCCKVPVFAAPIEVATGLATAKARGVENMLLTAVAEVLNGLNMKRSPALGAEPVGLSKSSPSMRAIRVDGAGVGAGTWGKVVTMPSERRVMVPLVPVVKTIS